jgi:hypothetical protein
MAADRRGTGRGRSPHHGLSPYHRDVSESPPLLAAESAPLAEIRAAVLTALLLVVLLVPALAVALRKDVRDGTDEIAHLSYVAQLQQSGAAWLPLTELRLLDPNSYRLTATPNYLNHPPGYYLLLARLGPMIEGRPAALTAHRLINVLLVMAGLAALLALARLAGFSHRALLILCVPLVTMPELPALAGSVNNDNAAFGGGALALCGVVGLLKTARLPWLLAALAGLLVAGLAKLNAFLLVGGLTGAVLAYLLWRRRFPAHWAAPVALAFVLALGPYAALIAQYGSPAPDTPGQVAMIADGVTRFGWADPPRLSFAAYLRHFATAMVTNWVPTMRADTVPKQALLLMPVAALLCALAGIAAAATRIVRRRETPLDVVAVAGFLAIATTLLLHIRYSYARHLATGWLLDAYPRYYLAVLAVLPLACLALLATLPAGRPRTALAGFLILGPIVLSLLALVLQAASPAPAG